MGALIGGGIGALLGIAGGYERARAIKRAQSDQAFLDLALKNPSVFAGDEKLLGEVKKRTSPEFADLLGGIGKHAAQFQQQVQGVMGGGAPQQGGQPSPAGQMVAGPGAPPAPNAQQDPMQAHIAQLNADIKKTEALIAQGAADPSSAPLVEALKSHLSSLNQQRTQATSEKYQHEEHEENRQQREADFQQNQARMNQFHAESMANVEASRAATEAARTAAQASLDQARREKVESDRRSHFDSFLKDQEKLVTAYTDPAKPKLFDTEANAKKVADAHNKHIDSARKKWSGLTDTTDTDWDSYKLEPEEVPGTIYGVKGYRLVPMSGSAESAAEGEIKEALPEGLPKGTKANGDGTFTTPGGHTVRPKK